MTATIGTDEHSLIQTAPLNLQHASRIQFAIDVDECNGGLGIYAAYVVDDEALLTDLKGEGSPN